MRQVLRAGALGRPRGIRWGGGCKRVPFSSHPLQQFLDSVGEGEGGMFRENSIETTILSRVKQITSPGGMHEISARAWCTGKTQKDWVEREVGGGIGMGNTCKSMANSCQCMTKPTTIL